MWHLRRRVWLPMPVGLLLLGVACCATAGLAAQVSKGPGDQAIAVAVADGHAGAFVAWCETGVRQYDVYVQHYDASIHATWATGAVHVTGAARLIDTYDMPALVADGSGGAIVIWTEYNLRNRSGQILAQRITGEGHALWGTRGIVVGEGTVCEPRAVTDMKGGALIVWGPDDLHLQRIAADGRACWPNGGIRLGVGGVVQVSIVPDGKSGAIVGWVDGRRYAELMIPDTDIYAQHVDASGRVLWSGGGKQLGRHGTLPSLNASDDGGATAAWVRTSGRPEQAIFAQRITFSGVLVWGDTGVVVRHSPSLWFLREGAVAGGVAAGASAFWMEVRSNAWQVHAQWIAKDGGHSDGDEGVLVSDGVVSPGLAVSNGRGGVAFAAWAHKETMAPGAALDYARIFVQRFGANGKTQWRQGGVPAGAPARGAGRPIVVADDGGGAFILWYAGVTAGAREIWLAHVLADGTAAPTNIRLGEASR